MMWISFNSTSQLYLINKTYCFITPNTYLVVNGNLNNESDCKLDNAIIIVQNDITNNGTLTMVGNSTLKCGRNWNNINGTFNAGNGTVVFDSNDGTINTGGNGANKKFYNIECNAAGKTKTQNGAIDCDNNFTITAGTWSTGGNSMNIAGNWTNNATFTHGNNLVTLDGINQTIGGTVATTFYNLTTNNTSTTLNINTTVKNVLALTKGAIDLNQKTLIIDNPSPTAISRTNGYILSDNIDQDFNSKLQWNIGTSATGEYIYPFGKNAFTYIPFKLNVTTPGVGNVSVSTYPTGGTNGTEIFNNRPHIITNLIGSDNFLENIYRAMHMVRRFWYINKSESNGTADLTFYWSKTSEDPISLFNTINFQRYSETIHHWDLPQLGQIFNIDLSLLTEHVIVPNVTNFSPWSGSSADNPLPITLLYFNGDCKDSIVELNWATASEINNDYFTIEYTNSLNDEDVMWTPIGIVNGAGNSNTMQTYQFIDKPILRDINAEIIYYRLKQTDYNGNYEYFSSIYVDCRIDNYINTEIINAYCEQKNNCNVVTVLFKMPGEINYTIKLYNVFGQLLATTKGISNEGENITQLYINEPLKESVYIVILHDNFQLKTKKVLLY
ncbi:MAG: hypothetical protein QM292_00940 [Bacteroidota bacterium]|nr:hypothetical protein [Bacteroidota bacterium]